MYGVITNVLIKEMRSNEEKYERSTNIFIINYLNIYVRAVQCFSQCKELFRVC